MDVYKNMYKSDQCMMNTAYVDGEALLSMIFAQIRHLGPILQNTKHCPDSPRHVHIHMIRYTRDYGSGT